MNAEHDGLAPPWALEVVDALVRVVDAVTYTEEVYDFLKERRKEHSQEYVSVTDVSTGDELTGTV